MMRFYLEIGVFFLKVDHSRREKRVVRLRRGTSPFSGQTLTTSLAVAQRFVVAASAYEAGVLRRAASQQ